MILTKGARYKATIRLGWLQGVASNGQVAEKLTDAGFIGVVVEGSGRDRTATGTWAGETQDAELPDQIKSAEVIP